MSRVCVVGLGYVGLPTAVLLAMSGRQIVGVDTNPHVLEALASGRALLREPGLAALTAQAVASGRMVGSSQPEPADAFIVAVPTPVRGLAHKRADLTFVASAVEAVARVLRPGNLVILESTSPPGTTEHMVGPILERGSGLHTGCDFLLCHCPERVLPGQVLNEIVNNARIIGGIDRASAEAAQDLYSSFVRGKIVLTDATTAELVKLMENIHRDVNIALANELALVAEHVGVNIWEAIELANHHPRVQVLRPGPGVGGHCIAVDPWFMVGAAPRFTPLVAASRAVNDGMPLHVVDLVESMLGGLAGRRVVILGLTYKAGVDDTRESPSAVVIEHLRRAGAHVSAHDAVVAMEIPLDTLADGADCLVLLVDHQAYAHLDPSVIAARMRRKVLVDARGFFDVEAWTEAGFEVARLGDGRQYEPRPQLDRQSAQLDRQSAQLDRQSA